MEISCEWLSLKTNHNGNVEALDVPAVIKNGRTLVPVRAVSETFGANVEWIGDSKTVAVTTKQGQHKIKTVTWEKDIKDENGTTLIYITYSYPLIENTEENGYIDQLNDEYKAYAEKFVQESEEHADDARLMLKEMGVDYRPMEFSLSYEIQTDSLSILPQFKTIQQTSWWSYGVSSVEMVLNYYGRLGDLNEKTLADLRDDHSDIHMGTCLDQIIEMFDKVGGFELETT